MADAIAGADVDAAEVELVEPQRIRVVSTLSIQFSYKFFFSYADDFCKTSLQHAPDEKLRANLTENSFLDPPTLLLHLNSPRKTTLLEMLCVTSS